MLLATNYGIAWGTFPKQGSSGPDQIAAQLEICATATSEMDTLANQSLRATVDIEQEFGPDFVVTILPNGWARFRLSHWPILSLVGAGVSIGGQAPFTAIPVSALLTEHSGLPPTGSSVPAGAGPGPTAVLIAPGYVDWTAGRKGYLVQVTTVNGFPTTGIDTTAAAGATSLHVDDITGWTGARGTIHDPPLREDVTVASVTPDTAGATSGPGTLTLSGPLQFAHKPEVGLTTQADQRIVLTTMPHALLQAGLYLATHYGLIRGATGATMMSARGGAGGGAPRNDWYKMASDIVARYARVF